MRAGPRPRDAREDTLGNTIYKVFRRQANPRVKQVSVKRSLLFFNPCVKEVRVLMVTEKFAVKEHVCYTTTNFGCSPVNGKYLCERVLTAYLDSANNTQFFTSGCKCVND